MDTNLNDKSENLEYEQEIDIYEIMGIPDKDTPTETMGLLQGKMEEELATILTMSGDLDFGCTLCGETGYMANGEICTNPECQEELAKREKETLNKSRNSKLLRYYVPNKYLEEDWDYSKALANPPVVKTEPGAYANYCTVLDKIMIRAQENRMIFDSIMICSPPKTGKRRWAFTLLNKLNQNGIKTSGLEYLNDIDTNNVLNTQVLVICVTRYQFKENLDKLDYIVNKRRNRDLATIVISEVGSRYFISEVDNKFIHFDIKADFTT